jgi:proton-dependent oligopeptide transporter, POT family
MSNVMKIPRFLVLLFFVEMWERFSYYGMRALLVLFLTSNLGFSDPKAYAIYSLFAAICYMGPVLGGVIADRIAGFRNMVLIGGMIISIGHICMALVQFNSELIYLGLGLIAVGSGMFKGNITSLLGSCYKQDDNQERSRGFTLFYISINLGSALAAILCGYIARLYGWHCGFGIAGCGMVLGLIIFIKFQYLLGDNGLPPRPNLMRKRILKVNTVTILILSNLFFAFIIAKMLESSELFANIISFFGLLILCICGYFIIKLPQSQRKSIIVLLIMAWFHMCFFALEMQLGSLINLFTQRNVVNEVFGIPLPASISQSINPIAIIVFGLLIGSYSRFNKHYITAKFACGLFTIVISFFMLYVGCLNANAEGKVNYLYLIIAMAFMGLGELLISPVLQEQTTLIAPPPLKGLIMGIILFSLAYSNLAGIIISKFMSVSESAESLEIYKNGFLKITIFNLGLFISFLFCYPFVNSIIVQQGKKDHL